MSDDLESVSIIVSIFATGYLTSRFLSAMIEPLVPGVTEAVGIFLAGGMTFLLLSSAFVRSRQSKVKESK